MVGELREHGFFPCGCVGKVVEVPIQLEVGVCGDIYGGMGSVEWFQSPSGQELAFVGDVRSDCF